MDQISFFIEGKPVPKGRPRLGKGTVRTPKRTKAWEETVGWTATEYIKDPFECNLRVLLMFHVHDMNVRDLDNLIKSTLDGLNGVAWLDDNQITTIIATKELNRRLPGVNVIIEEDTDAHYPRP